MTKIERVKAEYLKFKKEYFDLVAKKEAIDKNKYIGNHYKDRIGALVSADPDIYVNWYVYFRVDKVSDVMSIRGMSFQFKKNHKEYVIKVDDLVGYRLDSAIKITKKEFHEKWREFLTKITDLPLSK